MNLMEIASQLFLDKLSAGGDKPSVSSVQSALQDLLPTDGGELDIKSLLDKFMGDGGGLAALAGSWLSDGGNLSLSADKLLSLLGESQVGEFASKLGLDTSTAASGLSDMIPELIDKSSSGGSLASDLAGSLFSGLKGKFF